mmetsp:Transcript_60558/g.170636  ORF Transcript_60558/g.170636 Transcript_60558/m.170636 type:complete len:386 (-) Transcript_60558:122-1279(-)
METSAAGGPSGPATAVQRGPGDSISVVYHRAMGPLGETVLDPVFAEVLFVTRWRQLPARLVPSAYPVAAALGALPAGIGRGMIHRSELLESIAALGSSQHSKGLTPSDEAFCGMLSHSIGKAIRALLFGDIGVWEDYTRPTLVQSAPLGWGWAVAWREWRRQQCGPPHPASLAGPQTATFLGLRDVLKALVERLGEADSFGAAVGEEVTALDARAYAHLAVLYSIPCERDSNLHALLASFPTLAHFCDRMDMRFGGIWPDARSFLAACPLEARTPAAVALLQRKAEGAGAGQAAAGRQEWWELWGWSRGSRGHWAEPHTPRPPFWQVYAFSVAAVVSLAIALLRGLGPVPPEGLAAPLARALRGTPAGGAADGRPSGDDGAAGEG